MPPQTNGSARHELNKRNVLIGTISLLVIAIAILAGIGLARGNSDITCTRTVSETTPCTNGSWSAWTIANQSQDVNACKITYTEQRTYTGVQITTGGTFSITGNMHGLNYCRNESYAGATGSYTTEYNACQVVENRTRVVDGSGTGASCVIGTGEGTVINDTTTVSLGATSTSAATTGSYADYLMYKEEKLATTSLKVVPSLVHVGSTAHVNWSASYVARCTVSGTNGDTWSAQSATAGKSATLSSAEGGEVTRPITMQTVYTLNCTTVSGKALTETATVDLIPTYTEPTGN